MPLIVFASPIVEAGRSFLEGSGGASKYIYLFPETRSGQTFHFPPLGSPRREALHICTASFVLLYKVCSERFFTDVINYPSSPKGRFFFLFPSQ